MRQQHEITARARQMYLLVEKYFSSNLSRKVFCERESITYSTFQWWLGQYRQNESSRATHRPEKVDNFVPIHVTVPEPSDARPAACHIEYPNGVVVRLGHADVHLISQLVQAGNN
jgi:hypothetical protein